MQFRSDRAQVVAIDIERDVCPQPLLKRKACLCDLLAPLKNTRI